MRRAGRSRRAGEIMAGRFDGPFSARGPVIGATFALAALSRRLVTSMDAADEDRFQPAEAGTDPPTKRARADPTELDAASDVAAGTYGVHVALPIGEAAEGGVYTRMDQAVGASTDASAGVADGVVVGAVDIATAMPDASAMLLPEGAPIAPSTSEEDAALLGNASVSLAACAIAYALQTVLEHEQVTSASTAFSESVCQILIDECRVVCPLDEVCPGPPPHISPRAPSRPPTPLHDAGSDLAPV